MHVPDSFEGTAPTYDAGPRDPFDALFARVEPVRGWLTRAQARLLHDEVLRVPSGALVVEIGSHHGRSTLVLAGARSDVSVVAVDAFQTGGRYGGRSARRLLERNLAAAGVADRVRIIEARSQDVRPSWDQSVDLVYVDGKHDYWSAGDDLRWAAFLPNGGHLLVHDCFSSIGVTLAVLGALLRDDVRYVARVGSLAVLRSESPRPWQRLSAARELPWFGRNVVLKVLLRLRLGRLAALMGHDDADDPY